MASMVLAKRSLCIAKQKVHNFFSHTAEDREPCFHRLYLNASLLLCYNSSSSSLRKATSKLLILVPIQPLLVFTRKFSFEDLEFSDKRHILKRKKQKTNHIQLCISSTSTTFCGYITPILFHSQLELFLPQNNCFISAVSICQQIDNK